ncbi:MAG: hypothetical protein E6H08_16235 [Bacteroidetes bacterium]|nr:MAG: hypothetical protein E6H08_16235 [Bacteroidota bacterium]
MKKYFSSLIAVALAIGFSAYTTISKKPKVSKDLTTYDWYSVDYSSNPSGEVPSGAILIFDDYTQADAQADDGCTNTAQKHCLRGFLTTPTFPTTSYDSSTPKPN